MACRVVDVMDTITERQPWQLGIPWWIEKWTSCVRQLTRLKQTGLFQLSELVALLKKSISATVGKMSIRFCFARYAIRNSNYSILYNYCWPKCTSKVNCKIVITGGNKFLVDVLNPHFKQQNNYCNCISSKIDQIHHIFCDIVWGWKTALVASCGGWGEIWVTSFGFLPNHDFKLRLKSVDISKASSTQAVLQHIEIR